MTSTCWRRYRCQALIPITSAAAVTKAAVSTCGNVTRVVRLFSTSHRLVSSARPRSGLIRNPTGCCIHEFAARMKNAERLVAMPTAQIVTRWASFGSRSHPKIHRPTNVASRKNAMSPSIASGAPKTSPTKREYWLQFIPNWNSWTMPVTTPMAKLMRKIFPQNFVMARYLALPVRYQAVCIRATSTESPSVIGTKRKW